MPDGLVQLSRLIQDRFARVAGRHELTPVQAKLLCILAHGPRGMAELAGCLGVEKAGMTGLIDRAERNGLVARSAVPGDRRALRVGLTEEGLRAATAFHAEVTGELDRLVDPLTPGDRHHFRRTMQTIIAADQEKNA